MTRMPPQAYTKEVLASAFDWLSRQNENVKKSIRNSDDLVGLYLKSTRLKEHQSSQNPANGYSADLSSAKSFRSELQGLALNLKQFEDKPVQDIPEEPRSEYLHELNLMMSTQASESSQQNTNTQISSAKPHSLIGMEPQHINAQAVASVNAPVRTVIANVPSTPPPYEDTAMTSPKELATAQESAETVLLKLDKKTISAINLAKERLNLSSNTEAIRVLVSLGEKHLKKIFGAEE